VEDHENDQLLVSDEPVLRACRHEHRVADVESVRRALHLERPRTFEDDVDLVVVVRPLPIRLGRDEDVHTELETGGRVDDLIPAGLEEALLCAFDVDPASRQACNPGSSMTASASSASGSWPPRTTRRGQGAWWSTAVETLPWNARRIGPQPCAPITIRRASRCFATEQILSTVEPVA